MSVKVEANGKRSVQVEVEVPGSPEEVWKAIATGPGISSWFVPTTVEERVGGTVLANFGPGMESESKITQWNPPQNFVAEGSGMTPDSPPMATEWIVEAKSGDTCLVRVVHSWFASSDEWDGQYESVENGWVGFFAILRLKLQHFPGQPSAAFDVTAICNGSESDGWAALTGPFGLADATEGKEVSPTAETPALSGRAEVVRSGDEMSMILRISEPAPGLCQFFAVPMGDQSYLSIRFFLYGDHSAEAVAKAEPVWSDWFTKRFPMEG